MLRTFEQENHVSLILIKKLFPIYQLDNYILGTSWSILCPLAGNEVRQEWCDVTVWLNTADRYEWSW